MGTGKTWNEEYKYHFFSFLRLYTHRSLFLSPLSPSLLFLLYKTIQAPTRTRTPEENDQTSKKKEQQERREEGGGGRGGGRLGYLKWRGERKE